MQVACPICRTPAHLNDQAAGSLVRCRSCGKSFVGPSHLAVIGKPHKLSSFPVVGLLLLHYVTVGLFPLIHLNLMHDKLPRIRRTDPSGLVAVGLCFVPFVNLIWFFFTLRCLCLRINEQRRLRGMSETAPQTLAVIVSALLLCGFVTTILPITGWVLLGATNVILIPVFVAVLQASVNELVEHAEPAAGESAQHSHDAASPPCLTGDRHRDLGPNREHRPLGRAATGPGGGLQR